MGRMKARFSQLHFVQAALCALAFSFFLTVAWLIQIFLGFTAFPNNIGMHDNTHPALGIEWPDAVVSLALSPKGQTHPLLADIEQWDESNLDSTMV